MDTPHGSRGTAQCNDLRTRLERGAIFVPRTCCGCVRKPLDMSANALAIALRVPISRIAEIVKAKRAISADTSLRLAYYFGTTPEFWMDLQSKYDLDVAKDELEAEIKREIRPRETTRLVRRTFSALSGTRRRH